MIVPGLHLPTGSNELLIFCKRFLELSFRGIQGVLKLLFAAAPCYRMPSASPV
jgi:hypothetical protein